jgi:hypothetical protein
MPKQSDLRLSVLAAAALVAAYLFAAADWGKLTGPPPGWTDHNALRRQANATAAKQIHERFGRPNP